MNNTTRAWKDPVLRATMSEEELAALPANPAGAVELTDRALDNVRGLGDIAYGGTPVSPMTVFPPRPSVPV
ncbi:mersacidin/lichenicidin family type 2 lantibiotic [Allokutzneria albata]|nr:mersacidin/lichenicidin family type 2 lantibiotic [Allokutzneria albata]